MLNGSEGNEESLRVGGLGVELCDKYVYLGSPFTSDGSASSVARMHAVARMAHAIKFVSFI